ncbi:hypothetical protein ACRALDRAFT_208945 [Sodiomyces alcalophilus JCM 7366]|uniref:uncharacterized protein n=1 Tax=Sodiomyces alcalophilus JCM 7366 TaxID=591952 RepID=UPI0039B50B4A
MSWASLFGQGWTRQRTRRQGPTDLDKAVGSKLWHGGLLSPAACSKSKPLRAIKYEPAPCRESGQRVNTTKVSSARCQGTPTPVVVRLMKFGGTCAVRIYLSQLSSQRSISCSCAWGEEHENWLLGKRGWMVATPSLLCDTRSEETEIIHVTLSSTAPNGQLHRIQRTACWMNVCTSLLAIAASILLVARRFMTQAVQLWGREPGQGGEGTKSTLNEARWEIDTFAPSAQCGKSIGETHHFTTVPTLPKVASGWMRTVEWGRKILRSFRLANPTYLTESDRDASPDSSYVCCHPLLLPFPSSFPPFGTLAIRKQKYFGSQTGVQASTYLPSQAEDDEIAKWGSTYLPTYAGGEDFALTRARLSTV